MEHYLENVAGWDAGFGLDIQKFCASDGFWLVQ